MLTDPWVVFGLAAQGMFMLRFVIQWIASERRKRSYIPVSFWYFSLLGGAMLLSYAIKKRDPVFILGQSLGCVIYVRNLRLIQRRRRDHLDRVDARKEREGWDAADAAFEPGPAAAQSNPRPERA